MVGSRDSFESFQELLKSARNQCLNQLCSFGLLAGILLDSKWSLWVRLLIILLLLFQFSYELDMNEPIYQQFRSTYEVRYFFLSHYIQFFVANYHQSDLLVKIIALRRLNRGSKRLIWNGLVSSGYP